MLCKGYSEGFGPGSQISSPLPATCFTDTILLPLPTYLFIILILSSLFFFFLRPKKSNESSISNLKEISTSKPQKWYSYRRFMRSTNTSRRCKAQIACVSLYYIFLVANILLAILEMARLSTIKFGVALLPIVVIGIFFAGVLHLSDGFNGLVPGYKHVLVFFWVANMIMAIVKTAGLAKEGAHGRSQSMYPVEDQLTDTGVMAGLYLLLAGLEVALWHMDRQRESREQRLLREASLWSGTTIIEEGASATK